ELCCGTVRQADLPTLIEVAAEAGFAAVTTNPDLYRDAGLSAAELRARLRDHGVRVSNIDGFGSGLPGMPRGAAIEPFRNLQGRDVSRVFTTPEEVFYRTAEDLGAESINLVHFCGDPATPLAALVEATGGICGRAAAQGLRIVFEFLPGTAVGDIAVAAELVAQVGAPNLGIMFDTRHLARSGGTLRDVARHADSFGAVQFSDLRSGEPDDGWRLLPGEGDLPLAEMAGLVRRAHPAMPIGVEVFSEVLFRMTPQAAACAAGEAMRAVIKAQSDASA
ncbi:MAG: sugar phosphate isomerase/epimerase, partial [Phenylobacterium sp.]|nr:sugar phosphate isomerase/epimerase [Phenylobacterium sp.]